jgi:hypothetical protein
MRYKNFEKDSFLQAFVLEISSFYEMYYETRIKRSVAVFENSQTSKTDPFLVSWTVCPTCSDLKVRSDPIGNACTRCY